LTPLQFQHRILLPATDAFSYQDSFAARTLLMAIAGQESNWTWRKQQFGPARGFWQFEMSGGVVGVVSHPVSAPHLQQFCEDWELPFDATRIYEAIAWCDPLAYACARLLLLTDPRPLPEPGQIAASWDYYQRNWRPGAPRREIWDSRYAAALNPTTMEA
jgi:hypothetical protein